MISFSPSLLAQACIPTEHGPRIFASGGRSSLEEVVLEAPWKRLATLGPCYGTPSSFIHSDCLSFFFSCSEDASQPRSGTSTARTRSANPEEYLEGGLSGSLGTEKEGGGGEGRRREEDVRLLLVVFTMLGGWSGRFGLLGRFPPGASFRTPNSNIGFRVWMPW